MQLTGISRKQAGVIFANWKRGNIEATQSIISEVYNYSEFRTVNAQQCECDMVDYLRECIDAIFANDYSAAQDRLDRFVAVRNLHYTPAI